MLITHYATEDMLACGHAEFLIGRGRAISFDNRWSVRWNSGHGPRRHTQEYLHVYLRGNAYCVIHRYGTSSSQTMTAMPDILRRKIDARGLAPLPQSQYAAEARSLNLYEIFARNIERFETSLP